MVYLGSIRREHGILLCVDAISDLNDVSLTLKGPITPGFLRFMNRRYSGLLRSGRLEIDTSYTAQGYLLPFLSHFDLGFCFYDLSKGKNIDFNYLSSPSGKMFAYFAAGVPVVGSDIIGLEPVREYAAGLLVADHSPESVRQAVCEVMKNIKDLKQGCRNAAEAFDFSRHAEKYMESLLGQRLTQSSY